MPNLRRFLATWWTTALLTPASPACFAAAALSTNQYFEAFGINHISWTLTLFLVGIVTSFAGFVDTFRKVERWRRAAKQSDDFARRAELAELALIKTICDELRGMIGIVGLWSNGRANAFICKHEHFVLAGRYSPNPQYSRSVGRDSYPINHGILGEAWSRGQAEAPSLPESGLINSGRPTRNWLIAQSRLGIPQEVATGFTMRSRCYAALRLERDGVPLGVVLIEDTRPVADTPPSRLGGAPGGSLDALKAFDTEDTDSIRILARTLEQLRHLESHQLRERIRQYLTDR